MARKPVRAARGLRSALDALATAAGFRLAEFLYSTDDGTLVLATGVDDYRELSGASIFTSAARTAKAGQRIICNTSAGTVTITLPAAPTAADVIDIGRIGANNAIIARNGNQLAGFAENFVIDTNMVGVSCAWINGVWRVSPWSIA